MMSYSEFCRTEVDAGRRFPSISQYHAAVDDLDYRRIAAKGEETLKTDTERLIQDAHDIIDAHNTECYYESAVHCVWCNTKGYDGAGLIHAADCIVVRLRRWISHHS